MTSRRRSAAITEGPSRAPARAMLKAVGFTDDDLKKPLIGVANTWIEIGPCNFDSDRRPDTRRQHVDARLYRHDPGVGQSRILHDTIEFGPQQLRRHALAPFVGRP